MRREQLGEFEELVLMAVAALNGEAYGLSVRTLLANEAGREVSLGAIHATLYRLQDKGYLESGLEGATETRGGRRKRMFRVTGAAKRALSQARTVRETLWSLMPKAIRTEVAS